jgi:hypothetical protein
LNLVKDGKLRPIAEDDIIRETLLASDGEIVNPRVREAFKLPQLTTQTTG